MMSWDKIMWTKFKGILLTKQGLTIKAWAKKNNIDHSRLENIKRKRVKPTAKEIELINKVLESE